MGKVFHVDGREKKQIQSALGSKSSSYTTDCRARVLSPCPVIVDNKQPDSSVSYSPSNVVFFRGTVFVQSLLSRVLPIISGDISPCHVVFYTAFAHSLLSQVLPVISGDISPCQTIPT